MGLQEALLLIGIVIIAAVAVGSYDLARLQRRERARQAKEPGQATNAYLDINPGPPAEGEHRLLDGQGIPEDAAGGHDSPIYRALGALEEVATKPLDLRPTMARRPTGAGMGFEVERLFPAGSTQGPSPKIDFIIYLPGTGPVMRDQALGIYKQHEYVLRKPRQLYGLRYLSGVWSALERDADDAQYSDLALALQLVDSSGPADEAELNAFSQVALKMADAFNRPMRLAMTVEEALARAQELQRFAHAYDVIASISIVANNAHDFDGRTIEQAASQHGMQLGAMNIFHVKSDNAAGCRHLFSMANRYNPGAFDPAHLDDFHTRGLTLFMTVPCVHNPAQVFTKMVETARSLAQTLNGSLADQDERPLTEEGLAAIERQLKRIAADMTAHGIVPGSEAAVRFFGA
jgi:cell division protein ZipA